MLKSGYKSLFTCIQACITLLNVISQRILAGYLCFNDVVGFLHKRASLFSHFP